MNKNVLTYLPPQPSEADAPDTLLSVAVVTEMHDNMPASVTLNGLSYNVVGFLSLMPGIVSGARLGDKVLISPVQDGVLIHGVVMPTGTPARASFGFVEGKLVIEAQGAVVLKSGSATVELSEAGEIRIDGKNVRTKAKKTLTLQGGQVSLN
ncbi:MAG: hypothetical protein Q7U91_05740 [Sideroxyarcus sp.]|nr:hypothetical protein [Sideroxyarcus sp.]